MPDESRHNPFYFIHKALRHGHCRMLAGLGTHDFGQEAETAELLGRLTRLVDLSRFAARSETEVLLNAAEGGHWGVPAGLAQDQCGHALALSEIESLIRALKVTIPRRRHMAGRTLYRCYALFSAADMARMDAEETELLGVLHRSFTDEELRRLETDMFRSLPLGALATCLEMMLPALNHMERGELRAKLNAMFAPEDCARLLANVACSLRPAADDEAA